MAISSMFTFLMHSTDGTAYTKLVDIKSHPAMMNPPEMLDTTTLTNTGRTYIPGIQENEAMTFTCNYTKADFNTLKALEGTDGYYAVWFGGTESNGTVTPNGTNGKFSFKGDLRVSKDEGSVNEVENMTITIAPSTDIAFE